MNMYTQLEDGTYVPVIPEPFWYKSWRTLFRFRPACYQCTKKEPPLIFKDRKEYEEHYIKYHSSDEQ